MLSRTFRRAGSLWKFVMEMKNWSKERSETRLVKEVAEKAHKFDVLWLHHNFLVDQEIASEQQKTGIHK